MNAFCEHHKDNIRFSYRCFDRILLNGLIQPFQQPERAVGFFSTYREQYPVSRDVLTEIADQFRHWVTNRAEKWNAPILFWRLPRAGGMSSSSRTSGTPNQMTSSRFCGPESPGES